MVNDALVQIGETFGCEIEFDDLTSNTDFSGLGWKKTHDASIETPVAFIGGLGDVIVKQKDSNSIIKLLNYYNGVSGVELVSPILDTNDENLLNCFKSITNLAIKNGENIFSERSGIHFHISLPNPTLSILKNIIRFGKYFEDLFFYVGSMGYTFRGIKNDSIYCRPITKSGPPCIPYKGYYAQVFNTEDLLNARTRDDFWTMYGDCQNHTGRYNPVRYTWLNLYPLCPYGQYRGTLEFRIFNKSLNPIFIYSSLILCKKFVQLVLSTSFQLAKENDLLGENSIYNTKKSANDIIDNLMRLHEITEIEPVVLNTLIHIIQQSPPIILNNDYVFTHIRQVESEYWRNSNYRPEILRKDQIKKPDYIDIHVLRGEA